MITREMLEANTALASMSDEQKNAIVTLSKNDEDSVIAKKTGEIYGALDADVLSVSGIEKNGTEKTYDYAKRVLGEFKTKAESANGLQTQVDALTKEKARLEKAIAEGSADKETLKKLKQAEADLTSITTKYTELNTKFQTVNEEHQKALFGVKLDNVLTAATAGLKFKDNLPEAVRRVVLNNAIATIKSYDSEFVTKDGVETLVFKDENGGIRRNDANALEPCTAAELLTAELTRMDVLETKRVQPGGGTGGAGGKGGAISIGGARTQIEANDAITATLMSQGLTQGSEEFQKAMDEAWRNNNVQNLPIN